MVRTSQGGVRDIQGLQELCEGYLVEENEGLVRVGLGII